MNELERVAEDVEALGEVLIESLGERSNRFRMWWA